MKRSISILVLMLAAALLWPAVLCQAQQQTSCRSFDAIGQAALPSSTPLGFTFDLWGGPLYVMFDGQFVSDMAVFSGNDGSPVFRQHVGQGKGGSYTIGLHCTAPSVPLAPYTCTDTLSFEVPTAIFTNPPGPSGFRGYIGNTAKIAGGTGIFAGASGNLSVRGPAVAWPDTNPFGASGRWNPEISGHICGIP